MKAKNSNGILTLFPEGRIDTNNAAQIEKELFDAVNTPEDVNEIKEKVGASTPTSEILWWAMLDSNQRPHPCEGCALPLSQSPVQKV